MWFPFFWRRKKTLPVPVPQPRQAMKRVIVGFIIGGAISSIIGSALMQRSSRKKELEEAEGGDDQEGKED